jgi:hypothetical protein
MAVLPYAEHLPVILMRLIPTFVRGRKLEYKKNELQNQNRKLFFQSKPFYWDANNAWGGFWGGCGR